MVLNSLRLTDLGLGIGMEPNTKPSFAISRTEPNLLLRTVRARFCPFVFVQSYNQKTGVVTEEKKWRTSCSLNFELINLFSLRTQLPRISEINTQFGWWAGSWCKNFGRWLIMNKLCHLKFIFTVFITPFYSKPRQCVHKILITVSTFYSV